MSSYPITNEVEVIGAVLDAGKVSLTDGTFSTTIRPNDATTTYDLPLPPTAGTSGQVLSMTSPTVTGWTSVSSSAPLLWIIDQRETSGTNGGNLSGTWVPRSLNTITSTPGAGTDVQLAVAPATTDQLLIQPGDYFIFGRVPVGNNGAHKGALWNEGIGGVEVLGTAEQCDFNTQTSSYVIGTFNVVSATVFSIRSHLWFSSGSTVQGGYAVGISGNEEVYTKIYIEKV